MNFKTKDVEYMNRIRKFVVENSQDPNSWKYADNQLYLSDAREYLKSLSTTPVTTGVGTFLPKYVYIVESMESQEELISKINLQESRIIPIIKTTSVDEELQIKVLLKEVQKLLPQFIIMFKTDPEYEKVGIVLSKIINNILYIDDISKL